MQLITQGFTSKHPGTEAAAAAGHASYQRLDTCAFEIAEGQWLVLIDDKLFGFRKADA